jgi:hypothetical protein
MESLLGGPSKRVRSDPLLHVYVGYRYRKARFEVKEPRQPALDDESSD